MLPRFPAGAGTREIGFKRKGKQGKEEFLKGKCNQGCRHEGSLNAVHVVPVEACLPQVYLSYKGDWDAFVGSSSSCSSSWYCSTRLNHSPADCLHVTVIVTQEGITGVDALVNQSLPHCIGYIAVVQVECELCCCHGWLVAGS